MAVVKHQSQIVSGIVRFKSTSQYGSLVMLYAIQYGLAVSKVLVSMADLSGPHIPGTCCRFKSTSQYGSFPVVRHECCLRFCGFKSTSQYGRAFPLREAILLTDCFKSTSQYSMWGKTFMFSQIYFHHSILNFLQFLEL